MTSVQRIQAIYDKAAAEIEQPIEGIDPKYKRHAASVFLTRTSLKALAIVLRQAQEAGQ